MPPGYISASKHVALLLFKAAVLDVWPPDGKKKQVDIFPACKVVAEIVICSEIHTSHLLIFSPLSLWFFFTEARKQLWLQNVFLIL